MDDEIIFSDYGVFSVENSDKEVYGRLEIKANGIEKLILMDKLFEPIIY
ncbi:hypothetical protein PT277_08495 [Acetobacteraceae bacterium ESL0709]|nr:hypothetical protein [Acetobacteraceae bacterium ESL0697]MDF7678721.1 hypothetical protein [Acetobacteraceae bacterium ESL0709]